MSDLRCERYTLDAGDLYIYFPAEMSVEDVADAETHLAMLTRRMRRRAEAAALTTETPHDRHQHD